MKSRYILVALLAVFGNGFLFFCVALPAMLNQGYFAGDLDRYGEMNYEFILMLTFLILSMGFFLNSLWEGFRGD